VNFDELIVSDPKICGGTPVVRGTRVTLRTILASLAEGDTEEQILKSFPTLSAEQLHGVVASAVTST